MTQNTSKKGDKYIYSTLSNDQIYASYHKRVGAREQAMKRANGIFIAGQANVTNKNFITPKGVVTKISAEEFEAIKKCQGFNDHLSAGYLSVEDKEFKPEDVAKSMKAKDESAPKAESDFEEDKKPKTGKAK